MNAKLEFPPKNNNGKIGISNSSLREASKENIFSGTKDSLPGVNPVSIVASNQIQMDKQINMNTVYTPSISKDIPKSNSNSSKEIIPIAEDKNNQ